jgi:Mg2+ and Co2+ transporter CorA
MTNDNTSLRSSFNKIQTERNNLFESQKDIADYCNDLKKKFKNFVQTVEIYEKNVAENEKEKEDLIKYYEDILKNLGITLDYIDFKKKKLVEENHELSSASQNLSNEILKYELEINLLMKKKEEQREIYLDILRADKVRMDELEMKYSLLQKKVK